MSCLDDYYVIPNYLESQSLANSIANFISLGHGSRLFSFSPPFQGDKRSYSYREGGGGGSNRRNANCFLFEPRSG